MRNGGRSQNMTRRRGGGKPGVLEAEMLVFGLKSRKYFPGRMLEVAIDEVSSLFLLPEVAIDEVSGL